MMGQRAARPPVWGQERKSPMEHLRRLWVLLATEEVLLLREDGTTTRVTRVRRAIRS
jgi:hypothetical protein